MYLSPCSSLVAAGVESEDELDYSEDEVETAYTVAQSLACPSAENTGPANHISHNLSSDT
jgi:hypothetical protein